MRTSLSISKLQYALMLPHCQEPCHIKLPPPSFYGFFLFFLNGVQFSAEFIAISLTKCQTPMSLGWRCPGAPQTIKDIVGVIKNLYRITICKSD